MSPETGEKQSCVRLRLSCRSCLVPTRWARYAEIGDRRLSLYRTDRRMNETKRHVDPTRAPVAEQEQETAPRSFKLRLRLRFTTRR